MQIHRKRQKALQAQGQQPHVSELAPYRWHIHGLPEMAFLLVPARAALMLKPRHTPSPMAEHAATGTQRTGAHGRRGLPSSVGVLGQVDPAARAGRGHGEPRPRAGRVEAMPARGAHRMLGPGEALEANRARLAAPRQVLGGHAVQVDLGRRSQPHGRFSLRLLLREPDVRSNHLDPLAPGHLGRGDVEDEAPGGAFETRAPALPHMALERPQLELRPAAGDFADLARRHRQVDTALESHASHMAAIGKLRYIPTERAVLHRDMAASPTEKLQRNVRTLLPHIARE
eukprot:CAMPEP_0198499594 /NCGR_PEP_ID=MMETSP1462-20131121/7705_1 /TAXON_ID=1333877 /ORGANISM="Brandtodinium nutriculum, Strain RCC3387" /LENGTH=285 /DNA_ID=CAMNT_0044228577 /DNA_START=166 /DNA_END=1019 /DNA_ORIENTATION=+